MNIQILNRVMYENYLDIYFEKNQKEGNISDTSLDRQTAEKVCDILRGMNIVAKIVPGQGSKVRVAVPRESIQAASSSALIGQDVSELGVSTVKNPPISDKEAFKSAFSWKNANRPVSPLKAGDKVSYSHDGIPLFDQKWSPFTAQMICQGSVYDFPDDYHKKAQVLLNRFLEKNPDFKTEEYQDTHPALMLAALNLAIKVEEELAVWNVEFADILARDIIDPAGGEQEAIRTIRTIRKDLDSMEQMFLKGIEWNIQCELPIKEEMQSFILEPPVEDAKIEAFFADKPEGSFVIQKDEDQYVAEIKINEPKNEDESDIETKLVKFKFNENGQTEEIRDDGGKPDIQNDYLTLILRQGGTELFS